MNLYLKKFKSQGGGLNYPALFGIPADQRIAAMAKRNIAETVKVVVVVLTMALENINVSRKMNDIQVLDLAEAIVDDADNGDNISIEDLCLFLQKFTRGEYGEFYEAIDQVKFLARFNKFRDERWEAARMIQENKHIEYKGMGPTREAKMTDFDEHLAAFTNKLREMKDELIEAKREKQKREKQ